MTPLPPQPSAPPPAQATGVEPVVVKGLVVSPGIVIGTALVLSTNPRRVPTRTIRPDEIETEVARFERAVQASIEELRELHDQAHAEMGAETAKIFLVHAGMLADKKSLTGPIAEMIRSQRAGAEHAVSRVLGALADKFRSSPSSAFTTKVNDIDDLAQRLLDQLVGRSASRLAHAPPNTIVIANDLTPSQAAGFNRQNIIGFATDLGGRTSHTAIVARALSMPAVVGCRSVTSAARDGAPVLLDGDTGTVVVNPSEEQIAQARGHIEQRRVYQLSLQEIAGQPSVTLDGTAIEILGNIEFPEEAASVLSMGGQGVGLYRTEFLYLTGTSEPSEEDHFKAYARCVELMAGKPLTIRTVDLGADKYTQSRSEVAERNPFLGCRSIRYCLRDQPMFKRQLRALLRASALGPIKIMFPLITSLSELRQARYLLKDSMEELAEEGVAFDHAVKLGMMVEVPSAALMADAFAREVDFFSIGTNDLIQYTLAVDRTNERVANLYTPAHPAVVRLIRDTVRSARRHSIPVSCCGESAGDLEYALLLIGLGLRTLSMSSAAIPSIKRLVRSVEVKQCERIARRALSFDSEAQLSLYLRERARTILPEAFDGRSAD